MNNLTINDLSSVDDLISKVMPDCLEMAGLRSEFAVDKFTVAQEGPFLAHRFHFLMRQYSLTLSELKRLMITKERCRRKREIRQRGEEYPGATEFADLDIAELDNEEFLLDIDIRNKRLTIQRYEQCRLALISHNGGKPITDEQWNAEEMEYWVWSLTNSAIDDYRARVSGVSSGVFRNARLMAEKPLLSDKHQFNLPDEMIAAADMLKHQKLIDESAKLLGVLKPYEPASNGACSE